MDRRTLLYRLAAVAAGGLAAGCTSAGEVPVTAPPGPDALPETKTEFQYEEGDESGESADANPFTATEWDFFAGEDGNLIVSVTVANSGRLPHTGLVEVHASSDEGEWTNQQYVTLQEDETGTVQFHFPVNFRTFNASSPDIRITFPSGTPRTDLPTEWETSESAVAESGDGNESTGT